jgi:hypothetical protein
MVSTPECFVLMQGKGLCDGFLWPYECGRLADFSWSDGTPASRFETRRGTLFMHPRAIYSYGYREEHDFTRAAMRAQLTAKTPPGILTVGTLRSHPPCDRSVYLTRDDCAVKLEFPVCTPTEEQEIASVLRGNIPGASVFSGPQWLSGLQPPTPSLLKTWTLAWQTPHRSKLSVMAVLVIAVTGLSLAGFVERTWYVVAGCFALVFMAFFVSLCREMRSAQKYQPDSIPPPPPR